MADNCCSRTTQREQEIKKKLINRLSRLEGQIRGIKNMVENDSYCIDVLTQCAAASAALSAFNKELISEHIKGCVTRDIRSGDDGSVDELLQTLQKLMK